MAVQNNNISLAWRQAREDAQSDTVPDAVVDFADVYARLIQLGWGTQAAKSVEYGYCDQPMANHISNGIHVLIRLYELTDSISENDLRTMIALLTAHDYHKLRDDDGGPDEFDIWLSEVEEFVAHTRLDEYAPSVSAEMFQAAMVMLHERSKNAKVNVPPLEFDEYRTLLQFADKAASTSAPEGFQDARQARGLRTALDRDCTVNYHRVRRTRGLVTNIINQSVSDALDDLGYKLLMIYQNGCTYIGDQGQTEIEVDNALIDRVYDHFLANLRTAHTSFQNPNNLADGFPLNRNYRFYKVGDRDFVFASPEEVVRAIVKRGVADAQRGDDLKENAPSVADEIREVSQVSGWDIEPTRRVDGIARLVHTIRHEIIPLITDDDPVEAVCDVFRLGNDARAAIAETAERRPDLVTDSKDHWPIKYLIAQETIEEYYTGDSPDKVADTMAADLVAAFESFESWDTSNGFQSQDILDELKSFILYNVEIDGQRLIRCTGGRDEYDRYEDRRMAADAKRDGDDHECGLCGYPTSADKSEGFRLLKDAPTEIEFEHEDGNVRSLRHANSAYEYCYQCQLDLALRFTRQEVDNDDRLYIHIMPDYFYSPLSWRSYRAIFDSYMKMNTMNIEELAESVFSTDAAHGYKEWLTSVHGDDPGKEFIHDQSSAFRPDTGFGTHAISRKTRRSVTETEELAVALCAAAYAGVRIHITKSPISQVNSNDFNTAVQIDDGFALRSKVGGSLSLSELRDTLSSVSALIRIKNALGRDDDPLDLLSAAATAPLPGALLLSHIDSEDGVDALNYVDEARYIDERIVADACATTLPDSLHEGWALDVSSSVAFDTAQLYQTNETLATLAWPFMEIGDLSQDTLCGPFDAAFEVIEEVDENIPNSELVPRIETAVAKRLNLNQVRPGRRYGARVTSFATTFVEDFVHGVCDGDISTVTRFNRSLRDAFFAAALDHAASTLNKEGGQ